MQMSELRKKKNIDLEIELLSLLREKFNLKMRLSSGKLQQPHLLSQVRKSIARIKTLYREREYYSNENKK